MSSFFHRASRFVALLLTTWTACDGAFQTPYCEYFADREECQSKSPMNVEDMGNGMVPPPGPIVPPPRVMKGPVGFAAPISLPISLNRDWVGVHQGNRLIFANKNINDATLMRYIFKFSLSLGWYLDQDNCNNCLKQVNNFDFTKDYLVSSNSLFYQIIPGAPGKSGFIIDQENSIFNYLTIDRSIAGYHPFAHADFDGMVFQLGENGNLTANSGSALFYQQSLSTAKLSVSYDRQNVSNDKYLTYCVGDLDQLGTLLSQQEVLIFEESTIVSAAHIQIDQSNNPMMIKDNDLKNLINSLRNEINMKFKIESGKLLRSAYISDLNNDGYADLLIGILNNIYVATYDPKIKGFFLWINPIVSLSEAERPRSITVSDLNGDSYPDLAIEVFNSGPSDYRNETPARVSFYINQQK